MRGTTIGIVLGIVAVVLVLLFFMYVIRRYQDSQTHGQDNPNNAWRERLDQLHYILLQVRASDMTLTQLPGLPEHLSQSLRDYFGEDTSPPGVPENLLIERVMRLEDWLVDIDQAIMQHPALNALPTLLTKQISQYVADRQKRLSSS